MAKQTFKLGQAPWEKQSYPVGQAPWDTQQPAQLDTPPMSLSDKLWSGMASIGNAIAPGAVEAIGTNLAQLASPVTQQGAVAKGQTQADRILAGQNAIGQTTLQQNVGTGLELGSLVAPATPGIRAIPSLAKSAVTGAAALGGDAAAANEDAGTIARQAGVGALLGSAFDAAGQAVSAAGKKIYKFIIPRDMREAGLLQTYQADKPFLERFADAATGAPSTAPRTAADTSFDLGLTGTESSLGVKAKRATNNLWNKLIQPSLDESGAKVNMDDFFTAVGDQIVKNNPELNRQGDLLEALQALSEPYKGKVVPIAELQKFKEGWAKFVPQKAYQGKDIAGAFGEIKNNAADLARQVIYDTLGPDVRRAYLDYGNLIGIQELGKKAMTGGRLKGGFGSFWSAIISEALTPIMTVGGQVLYKTGQGIQFMGPAGAMTVGQLLNYQEPTQSEQPATPPTEPVQQQSYTNDSTPMGRANPDGTITVKGPFSGEDITIDPMMGGGSIERVGVAKLTKIAKRIHKEDIGVMRDLTDYVAGSYKPDPKAAADLELAATRIWERYLSNFKLPKTMKGIANDFARLIELK